MNPTRAYGGYAVAALLARQGAWKRERDAIGGEIERLRALITEAHVEARKFERLIELEEAREKAAREKREDAELDEFATLRRGARAAKLGRVQRLNDPDHVFVGLALRVAHRQRCLCADRVRHARVARHHAGETRLEAEILITGHRELVEHLAGL